MSDDIDSLWTYFLTIEREFASTTEFAEPHSNNYKTFSDKYAGLILLIGSEVDVVSKELVKQISANAARNNIWDYQKTICARYPKLHEQEIVVPRYNIKFRPWESWQGNAPTSPKWWTAYNNVKHNRLFNRHVATQENTLNALCGLLLMNMYLHGRKVTLYPRPELLGGNFFAPVLVALPDAELPDWDELR